MVEDQKDYSIHGNMNICLNLRSKTFWIPPLVPLGDHTDPIGRDPQLNSRGCRSFEADPSTSMRLRQDVVLSDILVLPKLDAEGPEVVLVQLLV